MVPAQPPQSISSTPRSTCPIASASVAKNAAATAPAAVPSALTAPSVPRGTRWRVVTRYVVCPYACGGQPAPVPDAAGDAGD